MPSALQYELRQRKPFQSAAHEAVVGLMRTADLIRRLRPLPAPALPSAAPMLQLSAQ